MFDADRRRARRVADVIDVDHLRHVGVRGRIVERVGDQGRVVEPLGRILKHRLRAVIIGDRPFHMAAAAEHVKAVGDREAVAAAGVLPGILQVDRGLQAGEVLVDDQVDDAGDSVRTPGGRGAAGHNVNALNQGAGNNAEVDAAR